ncbi:DUF6318 family protein [Georgenia daeguensis]|uniref:DUF6318 domain-containing protein n=1 Tax=Georgenia daeguensis TaxID=908355 RepID=A0ABP8ETP3_9MICO
MPQGERLHRRLTVLGAVLVLAGGIAACTSGGGAEPDPTAGATGTATAPPSEDPPAERPEVEKPVPPETMARDDVAGAEAAAQYFLELYRYTYATGDLNAFQEMSHADCIFCSEVADDVSALYGKGGYVKDGAFTVERVSGQAPVEGNDFYRVDLLVTEAPSVRFEGSGDSQERSGGSNLLIFAVGRADTGWMVREVQIEEPDFNG